MFPCLAQNSSCFHRNCLVTAALVQQTQFPNKSKLVSEFVLPPTPTYNATKVVYQCLQIKQDVMQ